MICWRDRAGVMPACNFQASFAPFCVAANHYRAMYNMLLAGMVIAVLLVFLITLNYTIYKVRHTK